MLSRVQSAEEARKTRQALAVIYQHPVSNELEITCEECQFNDHCEYAWDPYNTNGDCLAMK